MKLDFAGNPYIGVYCTSSEELLVASTVVPKKALQKMSDALGIPFIQTTVGGSTVVGSLVRLNSHGIVMSGFATAGEIARFRGLNVISPPHKLNAMGNNILCNDRGAIVNPGYDADFIKQVEDALDVEAVRGTIAGIRTVGSWAVATNKGVLCHPHASDDERAFIGSALGTSASITTANYGTAQIGACIVANSKGAVIGGRTTPIEIGRIEDGLQLY